MSADPDEHPCAGCGTGEYCIWVGADDVCIPYPFLDDSVECRPLPAGCASADLCNDPACTAQICGGYQCTTGVDPCEFGGMIQCNGGHQCDLFEPNHCNVDGTTCLPISRDDDLAWDAFECVPIPQPGVPVGGPCTLTGDDNWRWGDCEPGAICHLIDGDTLQGVCKSLCAADEVTCADSTTACTVWGEDDLELPLCEPTCDPLDPLTCPAGDACLSISPGTEYAFVCIREFSGDGGAAFDDCEAVNHCDPGLECVSPLTACDPNAWGCCVPYCDLTQPVCPDDLTCVPFFGLVEAPPGHEDVGLCVD